jgi:hypothetical protein
MGGGSSKPSFVASEESAKGTLLGTPKSNLLPSEICVKTTQAVEKVDCLGEYRVVDFGQPLPVSAEIGRSSSVVGQLSIDSVVNVLALGMDKGRVRGRIDAPHKGWISLRLGNHCFAVPMQMSTDVVVAEVEAAAATDSPPQTTSESTIVRGATLEEEVTNWLQAVSGEGCTGTLMEWLRDGQVLCRTLNKIQPGMVKRINKQSSPFQQMENVTAFIQACRKFGVLEKDLFSTSDLHEGRHSKVVINCIASLGFVVQRSAPLFTGPYISVRSTSKENSRISFGSKARPGNLPPVYGEQGVLDAITDCIDDRFERVMVAVREDGIARGTPIDASVEMHDLSVRFRAAVRGLHEPFELAREFMDSTLRKNSDRRDELLRVFGDCEKIVHIRQVVTKLKEVLPPEYSTDDRFERCAKACETVEKIVHIRQVITKMKEALPPECSKDDRLDIEHLVRARTASHAPVSGNGESEFDAFPHFASLTKDRPRTTLSTDVLKEIHDLIAEMDELGGLDLLCRESHDVARAMDDFTTVANSMGSPAPRAQRAEKTTDLRRWNL